MTDMIISTLKMYWQWAWNLKRINVLHRTMLNRTQARDQENETPKYN